MNEIQVLLVDDHAQLRAELRRLIDNQPEIGLVAEAGGAQEAVRLALHSSFTVVVMDLSLPDGDGITATAQILQQRPELSVLGLSRHEDVGYVKRMLAVGARGYVLKRNIPDRLLTAIRTVAAEGISTPISPANSRRKHRNTAVSPRAKRCVRQQPRRVISALMR
jgi:DNA-binding NarL/FixJ family response regulator